ncbi:hypothetical protein [Ectopseudomonas hydrolytica]|uniref:hypothetical protein n=1 Tax=Ectopseudomonas hydrolytica TaxID=2493633 RepID=UPI0020B725EE|nr:MULTISPECIES: hypothetical protein [Pseudomonas]UTH34324.1 hypothetical protein NLY38_25525 [Pseudomonas hydrolytica]UTH38964.1 hypothetical protein NLY39_23525 [Pseudomonas sp. KHPS1]UZZ13647.1 hypothetical protein NDO41_26725 [Pseudomonas mendocina]
MQESRGFELMDLHHFLQPILDWLSTDHGRGRYGWVLVLEVACGIGGTLVAREIITKRAALKKRVTDQLFDRPLVATIVRTDEGKSTKLQARLERTSAGYVVTVQDGLGDSRQETMGTIEEVA